MEKMKIVIKYGTEAVTHAAGMDVAFLYQQASEISKLRERYDFVVVSSGAVAEGKALWAPHRELFNVDPSLQAYAMIGVGQYFLAWQKAMAKFDIPTGLVLVTHKEMDDPNERPVLERALSESRLAGVLPIVNQNDAICVDELEKLTYGGDNDGVGGHIASLIDADFFIMYTKNGGLINDDGYEVRTLTPEMYEDARKMVESRERQADSKGKGGMGSKLSAGRKAASQGCRVFIARSGIPIEAVINKESGTEIVAIAA
ncbi:MAG: glutamate 5-kinase [Patescibacteria group bacterium]|jgi:glutamate 5-kinase|nr:glutamate 5-kinase [Patescibacteria group bacterium]